MMTHANVEAYIELMVKLEEKSPRLTSEDRYDKPYGEWMREYDARDHFVRNYAWAVPSRNTIKRLVEFIGNDSVLELGAGSGLWAHLLQLKGVDIIPTDNKSEPCHRYFTDVENLDVEAALEKYSDRKVLLVCWPRMSFYESQLIGRPKVIFIGENDDGCTGTIVIPNVSPWKKVAQINHPRWLGLNDVTILYQRDPQT